MSNPTQTPTVAAPRENYPAAQKREVQQLLRQLCPRNAQGQYQSSALVRKLKLSQPYVSSILNAEDVTNDKNVNPIGTGSWVALHRALLAYSTASYAETAAWLQVQQYCATLQRHAEVRRLRGHCGSGKSEALQHYARNTDVVYVACRSGMTPQAFLRALLRELGMHKVPSRTDDMLFAATTELRQLPQGLVIIDDVYYLPDRALLLIKDMLDDTEGHCGWLLVGEDSMERRLEVGVQYHRPGYEALRDRTGRIPLEMPPLSPADKRAYLAFRELDNPLIEQWVVKHARTYRDLNKWLNLILRNLDEFKSAEDLDELLLNKYTPKR
jgi:hypothetical protein